MPPHDYTQMEADIAGLKAQVGEIHEFLLGDRLRSNGKKGWLETMEDRVDAIESKAFMAGRAIAAIAATLGVAVTAALTLVFTGTAKVVLRFLGVE